MAAGGMAAALAAVSAVAGCGLSGRDQNGADAIRVGCVLRPEPPVVGPARLVLSLADGRFPVENATVRVVGMMTHPGMAPVPIPITRRGNGIYDGAFRFTMAGDWALVVTVQLPDGRRTEKRVDVPGVRATG